VLHYSRYDIAGNGKNLHFTDKTTGEDYLDSEAGSKCAYIVVDRERHEITALTLERENLKMEFGKSGFQSSSDKSHTPLFSSTPRHLPHLNKVHLLHLT